ncbi:hypothetical protein KUL49_08190 [Alteromonas sp. KUL49]|nr:hypothetical protein KUL49_08190 [Alteromonas sp. KUL49]
MRASSQLNLQKRIKNKAHRRVLLASWTALLSAFSSFLVFAEEDETISNKAYHFSIPAQTADEALTYLAKQADTTLLFPFELAQAVVTNPIDGEFTLNEALTLLLKGTELAVVAGSEGHLSIRSRHESQASEVVKETQQEEVDEEFGLERIAVVGTRNLPRSAVSSPVPVDIIDGNELGSKGSGDVLTNLSRMVPSLNVNDQPINDATSLVRPANLRGMASDHTLLLLNGKRRHRSSVITFLGGGLSDGAQGPDISVIPAYGLKQVEVLRDGASAQYGSDAIAGVLNFVMKDSAEGGAIVLKTGIYSEGDGELFQLQANRGFALPNNGFLNATAEYRTQAGTSRSVQRDDALALINAGNNNVANPTQIWGSLDVDHDVKLAVNAGWDISTTAKGYGFVTYAYKDIQGGFYFRHPQSREGVFTQTDAATGEKSLLVADLDGLNQGISCPNIPITSENVLEQSDYLLIADNNTDLGQNCFAFNEWFPGGFTPQFGGKVTDGSMVIGAKRELASGWSMDTSLGIGYSDIQYTLSDTVNPSLGPDSPLSFSPGGVSQLEQSFNIDLSRLIQTPLEEPVSIAVGAEWRKETYVQHAGDEASYTAGPYAFYPPLGTSQGFSIGSNGFPGYQPQSEGRWSRSNWAVYSDLEFFIEEALQVGVAVRVENYSDFGATFDGKLTMRYVLNSNLALRGSVNTGFKAPTVGQSNVINVTTAYGVNGLEDQATLPPTDQISTQLGATPLEPEESINFSFGAVFQLGEKSFVTLDYFNIRLHDRISTTSAIPLSAADVENLVRIGREDAAKYKAVKYFTNDFDTLTQGIDIVGQHSTVLFEYPLNFLLTYNWTDTQVERVSLYPVTTDAGVIYRSNLTPQRIRMLEDNLPAHRGNFTAMYDIDKYSVVLRGNYFGGFYEDHLDASAGMDIESSAVVTVDIDFAYRLTDQLTLSVGAQNLLNEFPEVNPFAGQVGALYPPTSPSGINGAFYYAGVEFQFN